MKWAQVVRATANDAATGRRDTLEHDSLTAPVGDEATELAREHELHDLRDRHGRASSLADVVLGGQDGLVNVLGLVLGVAAATGSVHVVLAAGTAAAVADSVSMATVAFTSKRAEASRYVAEREREYRHIRRFPVLEREEVREIYRRKGLQGDLLERVVATVTSDPDVWVAVMMAEEHGLVPIGASRTLRSALVVGVASLVGSLVPLAPFLILPVAMGSWVAIGRAVVVLFALGAYKARTTVGHPLKAGLEMAAIGTASALVGYAVGALFRSPG